MSAESLTISRYSRCSARQRRCRSASSVMPMTPFIGVRISWLMLARNSLLARLAASAAASAWRYARLALEQRVVRPRQVPAGLELAPAQPLAHRRGDDRDAARGGDQ